MLGHSVKVSFYAKQAGDDCGEVFLLTTFINDINNVWAAIWLWLDSRKRGWEL